MTAGQPAAGAAPGGAANQAGMVRPSKLVHSTRAKFCSGRGQPGSQTGRAVPASQSQRALGRLGALWAKARVWPSGDQVRSVVTPGGRATTGRSASRPPTRRTV